jgi:hypothetical protein
MVVQNVIQEEGIAMANYATQEIPFTVFGFRKGMRKVS